jgi:hypothetical protein
MTGIAVGWLAIMDQDSENNRFLTDGTWLVRPPGPIRRATRSR